jgi:hypothetical protein
MWRSTDVMVTSGISSDMVMTQVKSCLCTPWSILYRDTRWRSVDTSCLRFLYFRWQNLRSGYFREGKKKSAALSGVETQLLGPPLSITRVYKHNCLALHSLLRLNYSGPSLIFAVWPSIRLSLPQESNAGRTSLVLEVSGSHTMTHHSR